MSERDPVVFLLSLAALLTLARLLGELARRGGLPLVVGEILAGVVLGPTLLGRIAPRARMWLFPPGAPETMLSGYTTVGIVLLLTVAGLEVELDIVRRRGKSALMTSVLGIALPLAGGYLLGHLLPDSDLVRPEYRTLVALFLGVALSISALPVIAKTLLDLGLFKTDVGLLVMAAAMINDIVGWLAFSLLLGPLRGGNFEPMSVARTVALTGVFVAGALLLGRPVLDRLLVRLQRDTNTAPRRILSLVVLLALFGASFTQAIGLHAVLGGFIIGVMVSDSPHVKERTRAVIHDFVTAIFAPVFFASLGLRVDFVKAFDARLCVLVFVIATAAKVLGCTVGARSGGLGWRPAAAVGFGLNARGAMEIILALLALDAGIIREHLFVALVVMALATSIVSGPMMKWLLGEQVAENLASLVRAGGFVDRLTARTPTEAIDELFVSLEGRLGALTDPARRAVLDREALTPTGLGEEVAIPHAAVEGLTKPVLALGRSSPGIDFDAPDGLPARLVFLLLVPPRAPEHEVRLLALLARVLIDPASRGALFDARTQEEVAAVFASREPALPAPHPATT